MASVPGGGGGGYLVMGYGGRGVEGGHYPVMGYWGCATEWDQILTTKQTIIMGLPFQAF